MQKDGNQVSFQEVLYFVWGYWMRQKGKFFVAVFCNNAAAVTEVIAPIFLSHVVAAMQQGPSASGAALHAIEAFLGITIAGLCFVKTHFFFYNRFETRLFAEVAQDAFDRIQTFSAEYHANTFAGSIVTKIKRAIGSVETFEDRILHNIIPTIVVLGGSSVVMTLKFPVLGAVFFTFLLCNITVALILLKYYAGPVQLAAADADDATGAALADAITGCVTTKMFSREAYESSRMEKVLQHMRFTRFLTYRRGSHTDTAQQILNISSLIIVLLGAWWYFQQGSIAVADVVYIVTVFTVASGYTRFLGDNIKNFIISSYDLHGVVAFAHQRPSVEDAKGARKLVVKRGEIVLDGLSFTYPSKKTPVFKNFSLTLRAGERVALVGHSGSGKSTFVKLVQRLYDPVRGRVLIDGQDIAQVTQESLRRQIALVPQEPILFHRSLAENIAYGKPDATRKEIERAARLAHAHEFINTLPQKYETLVGERGVKLSGGERQRVAIARAMLADTPILILDEATSSLDSESEKLIQDALHTLLEGKTAIVIAHRLSTIKSVDRILVFDKGNIVEEGTHGHLVKRKGGLYRRLYELQAGGFVG